MHTQTREALSSGDRYTRTVLPGLCGVLERGPHTYTPNQPTFFGGAVTSRVAHQIVCMSSQVPYRLHRRRGCGESHGLWPWQCTAGARIAFGVSATGWIESVGLGEDRLPDSGGTVDALQCPLWQYSQLLLPTFRPHSAVQRSVRPTSCVRHSMAPSHTCTRTLPACREYSAVAPYRRRTGCRPQTVALRRE